MVKMIIFLASCGAAIPYLQLGFQPESAFGFGAESRAVNGQSEVNGRVKRGYMKYPYTGLKNVGKYSEGIAG